MISRALWMTAAILLGTEVGQAPAEAQPTIYDSPNPAKPANEIDRLVFSKLSSLGIQPVLCSDAVFVRRAHLDVIGTLPSAEEARDFIENTGSEKKRAELIDQLLERKEFTDYWAMRWGDVLRIKAEFPVNLWPNAAQAYHRWVVESIAGNKSYNVFAREMLTSSGSNFRVGPVNFYRGIQNKTPEGIAGAVALTLMGSRTDSWPPERLAGMSVFFSQIGYKPTREWKEEVVFWDPLHTSKPAANVAPEKPEDKDKKAASEPAPVEVPQLPGPEALKAVFPDGKAITLSPDQDPREVFADWLIHPENPYFTKAIANRVWYWLLGRGIIHEPDDIRDDNPPSNAELMAYLEKELAASGYDLKKLYRLILNSSTYQLTSVARSDSPEAAANFASYPVRRLDAEVLIDAINNITGTTDLYTSPIPEPFTYIPQDIRAIAIADGSITSPFLTLFGRSARATGMENERNNNPVSGQWLFMLNSSQLQQKLERGPKLRAILESSRDPAAILDQLYLTILSRLPTDAERKAVAEFIKTTPSKRDAAIDIAWALINNPEFLYRH